jgi:hypothetical protein
MSKLWFNTTIISCCGICWDADVIGVVPVRINHYCLKYCNEIFTCEESLYIFSKLNSQQENRVKPTVREHGLKN